MNSFLIGVGIGAALIVTVGNAYVQLRLKNQVISRLLIAIRKEKREAKSLNNLLMDSSLSSDQVLYALTVLDNPATARVEKELVFWRDVADRLYEAFKHSASAKISTEGAAAIALYEETVKPKKDTK